MNENETLKELRRLYDLTQDELAEKANLSVHVLRRHETSSKAIPFKDLDQILNALKFTFSEFIALMNANSEFSKYNNLFYDIVHNPKVSAISQIYDYCQENKSKSTNDLILYCKVVRIFHDDYSKIVPDFTKVELNELSRQLLSQQVFTLTDYSVLALVGIKLDFKTYKKLVSKMIIATLDNPKTIYQLRSELEYRTSFANILNNIIHVSLNKKNFEAANTYYKHFQKFIESYLLTNFYPLIPYYRVLIDSNLQLSIHDLSALNRLPAGLIASNFHSQSKSFQNEIDKYVLQANVSEKDTTVII